MAFSIAWLQDFFLQNLHYWIILGIGCFAAYFIVKKFYHPTKFKVIDRNEIERLKFVERMKLNKARENCRFYHGNNLIGKVILEKMELIKTNPKGELKGLQFLVVKPLAMKVFPMGKEIPLILNRENTDEEVGKITLKQIIPVHNFSGIFYDETLEKPEMENKGNIIDFIKNDCIVRTSYEDAMSEFYVKAQEQATFNPEYAHDMGMKEKELQIELAKKRGKQTSI